MPEYRIYWTGTVTGTSVVKAENVEQAISIACSDAYDEGVDIEDYPDDWEVSKDFTRDMNEQ